MAQRQNDEMTRLTEAGFEQNEQMKRVSSWAAILFAPTLIAGDLRDELRPHARAAWTLGYPFAVVLMLLGRALYVLFKRRDWL